MDEFDFIVDTEWDYIDLLREISSDPNVVDNLWRDQDSSYEN